MRIHSRAGPRAILLLALVTCGLLPALGALPIPGGDPCGNGERERAGDRLAAGMGPAGYPRAAAGTGAAAAPIWPSPAAIPPCLCPSPTSDAACEYKRIPEPTEPSNADTGTAAAAISKLMVDAVFEVGGEAIGGIGGKLFSTRE